MRQTTPIRRTTPSRNTATGSCESLRSSLAALSADCPRCLPSPNIPISHETSTLPLASLPALLPYHAPHPVPSTPYHRYTLLLVRQPASSSGTFTPSKPSRTGFSLRSWLAENGYTPPAADGRAPAVHGVHMFREGGKLFGADGPEGRERGLAPHQATYAREMDAVRGVYERTLGREMVVFDKVTKEERYGVVGRKGRRVPV